MRVLILAEACNPDWASEPLIAYSAAKALADYVDVVVVTHARNRSAIESHGIGRAKVVYLDTDYIASPVHKISTFLKLSAASRTALRYPVQLAFEYEAWKYFRDDLREKKFDIIHRLTPISSAQPSAMSVWSPVPFVLGPVNGGLKWPSQFTQELRREKEWLRYVRGLKDLLPYAKSSYRKAAAILASFEYTIDLLPKGVRERVIDFPENGLDTSLFHSVRTKASRERLSFLFVGRLVPFKCVDIALQAFAASASLRKHSFHIIGDGPDRMRLEQLSEKLGLQECVTFHGWLPQADVSSWMREADVFVFPSIRESGAGVVLEAMMSGVACVVTDYGAPGQLISQGCGLKVALGTRQEFVDGFINGLETMVADSSLRDSLGKAAQEHVAAHFDWDVRARKIVEVYKWVLGKRSEKPDFYTCLKK